MDGPTGVNPVIGMVSQGNHENQTEDGTGAGGDNVTQNLILSYMDFSPDWKYVFSRAPGVRQGNEATARKSFEQVWETLCPEMSGRGGTLLRATPRLSDFSPDRPPLFC